jgi:hypothetical protein
VRPQASLVRICQPDHPYVVHYIKGTCVFCGRTVPAGTGLQLTYTTHYGDELVHEDVWWHNCCAIAHANVCGEHSKCPARKALITRYIFNRPRQRIPETS